MIKVYKEVDSNGTIRWLKTGTRILHNDDGPAVEYTDGAKYWCNDDDYHREGAPAVEYASGDKFWYKKGKLHREDGPAVEYADGRKEYWLNDKYFENIESDDEWLIKQLLE